MEIYILSAGRATKQPTWHNLPEDLQAVTKLVVPMAEDADYRQFPHVCEPGLRNVGAVRRWIMERATGNYLMLDDDLTFAMRRLDDPTKFVPAQPGDIRRAAQTIFGMLQEGTALVGMAMREGANRNPDDTLQAIRMARVYGYNLGLVRRHGIIFDRCLGMDDFDAALQLLRLGYPTIALNWIVQNQYGSNSRGGASAWRTLAVHAESARLLVQYHPEYVALREKATRVSWNGETRTDVLVQWKRALADGQLKARAVQQEGAAPLPLFA